MWLDLLSLSVPPPAPDTPECVPHHNNLELALSLFILAGMVASYLPQHYRIIQKGTSDGISPWFLLLGSVSASSTFLNIVILQWRVIQCCKILSLGPCLESLLGIAQLGVQFIMFGLVLVLFIIYFPANKKNAGSGNRHPQFSFLPDPSDEWALSLLIARFVGVQLAVCVFITILMLAFVGPDSQWTSLWASLLGITSVILATIQYVPQIMRTYRRKSVGALSIPMMLMQTPGAALLTLSLALRPGANWTTWIVYAVTGCLQGILLVMCIYYHFNATKQGYGDFDTAETEPLLAENHIVPNLHLPHPHRDQHQNSAHGTPASG